VSRKFAALPGRRPCNRVVPGRQSGNGRHPMHLQCPRPQSAYKRLQRHGITTTKSCVLSSNCNCVLESLLCACTPLAPLPYAWHMLFRNHDCKLTVQGGCAIRRVINDACNFRFRFYKAPAQHTCGRRLKTLVPATSPNNLDAYPQILNMSHLQCARVNPAYRHDPARPKPPICQACGVTPSCGDTAGCPPGRVA